MKPADVILLEGILVLYPPAVRNILNMKVYIDVDSDDRLARRGRFAVVSDQMHIVYGLADLNLRLVKGNSLSQNPQGLEALLHQYVRFVKRSHEDFVLPVSWLQQYSSLWYRTDCYYRQSSMPISLFPAAWPISPPSS